MFLSKGERRMLFESMGLRPELLQALAGLGFEKPTPVQARVIPLLLNNHRDLVALAQTGTGKTAAFGLPILQQWTVKPNSPQALVLCPTRELCLQIARDLTQLSAFMPSVRVLAVYGGSDIRTQLQALARGVHIVVATPGRMVDLLRRERADFSQVSRVVLDEADEMLSMGFEEDLKTILSATPDNAQTLLFSATMPRNVAAITRAYMTEAEEITIGARNAGAEHVSHEYVLVHAKDRYPALRRILDRIPGLYGIVFCRTRQETQDIADRLGRDGYPAESLHGDLSQQQRDRVMKKFRDHAIPLLVATDVAARGLDVKNLTHIVSFSLPDDLEAYTHRSGRTGRAGQSGTSIVLLHLRERYKLTHIEKNIGHKFVQCPVPSGDEICRARLDNWVRKWLDLDPAFGDLEACLPELFAKLADYSREDILRRVAFLEIRDLMAFYRQAPDLNVALPEHEPRREPGSVELVWNIGSVNGVTPQTLMRLAEAVSGRTHLPFGRIKITKMQSYTEVAAAFAKPLQDRVAAEKIEIDGRRVTVAIAQARKSYGTRKVFKA